MTERDSSPRANSQQLVEKVALMEKRLKEAGITFLRFFALVFLTLSFLCWLLVLLVLLVFVFLFASSWCCFLFQVLCSGSCLCCCWFPGFYYALSFGFVFFVFAFFEV